MYSACFPSQLLSINDSFLCPANERGFKHIGFLVLQIHILQEKNANKKHSCRSAA